ncbi:outer membrane lipoprotein LolB [Aliidiomarina indica]|uniref:outer membrane lipoprotein LolB n=1 Tax=Aliidiomarina indica TaxID=2749147 RepID=UPI00188E4952|nr:outer membrane lipoprotein LolB [Aliidiomarina indica]
MRLTFGRWYRLSRLPLLALCIAFLSACATTPPATDTAEPARHADHQAWLSQIVFWNIQGNVAFFNDADGERDAARYTWRQQHTPEATSFRLYHPLRGTLARLEQNEAGGVFTNLEGETFNAEHIDELLYTHTGMPIPFRLMSEAIIGLEPGVSIANRRWYENGALASYSADISQSSWNQQVWQVALSDYRVVVHNGRSFTMPHMIEATQYPLRIRFQISQWREVLVE